MASLGLKAVMDCHGVLSALDLLQFEDAYEVAHGARWDACMEDALVNKGVDERALTRLVLRRFYRLARL